MGDHQKLPLPNFPYSLKVILVKPSIEGNLGAIARNMLNFGFNDLNLVSPELTIGEEARKRAKQVKQEEHHEWRAQSGCSIHTRCQRRPLLGAPVHRRSVGDRAWLRDRSARAGSAASGSVSPERRAILSHDTNRHDLSSVTCSAGGTPHLGSVWACPGTSSGCWRHLFPPPLCTATSAPAQKVSELVVAIL